MNHIAKLVIGLASQGRTVQEAEETFGRTFVGQIMLDLRRGKEPLQGIGPAPRMYWRKFKEGIGLKVEPTISETESSK